jgi:hypothetical protein
MAKAIIIPYTTYEINKNIDRIAYRCSMDGLTHSDLYSEYEKYVTKSIAKNKDYYPFYFWAMKEKFNMYLWQPNLFNNKEEEEKRLEEFDEMKFKLTPYQRRLILTLYTKYRDMQHENKQFMLPYFEWALRVGKVIFDGQSVEV